MIYILLRASTGHWSEKDPGCEEAKKGSFPIWENGFFESVEEHDNWRTHTGEIQYEPWLSKGYNHDIYQGKISRQLDNVTVWYVDFNTIEELHAFTLKYGVVVVDPCDEYFRHPVITIYDDYMD